jgi:Fungal protein kinase
MGELKQSEIRGKYTEELLVFYGHAREVFASQPTRRFLHGFFIRGSFMELWVFDRSGLYSCEKFNLHQDPHRFIKIMVGYSMMSDEELGVNTSIERDETGKYIVFKGDE